MKKIGIAIISTIIIVLPYLIFFVIGFNQQHIFSKSYYAALVDKVAYLEKNKDDKKIILIGGSNVAFGFNSELLENDFPDYKVINFGLYASLGTKIMLDLSKEYINEGDIVAIIPEINSQSMSLYFNPNATLKAIEDDWSLLWKLPSNDRIKVIGESFNFIKDKKGKDVIIPDKTVYSRMNFNSHYDISYVDDEGNSLRTQNVIVGLHYDLSMPVTYDFTVDNNFFEYLNDFNMFVESKKAKLYYSFCPVLDLANSSSEEEIINFYWKIKNKLTFPTIGNPFEYIIDSHYFYDTNFHLNDNGAILRTKIFSNDLFRDVFNVNTISKIETPEMPEYAKMDSYEDNGYSSYYTYEAYGDTYAINGVSNEHVNDSSLITPTINEGKLVSVIKKGTFGDCQNLVKLIITDNISAIENDAFTNCKSLKEIYFTKSDPSQIQVDYTGKLLGDRTDITLFVPKGALNNYKTDYNFSCYSNYIRGY